MGVRNATGVSARRLPRGDEETATFHESASTSQTLCLMVDEGTKLVWSGHKDGKIRSWKMEQQFSDGNAFKEGFSWQAHRNPVLSMTMSFYGDIWSGSEGGNIRIWSWESLEKSLGLSAEERRMAALLVERSVIDLRAQVTVNAMSSLSVLFMSPGPTFKRIWINKRTEEFHPYPYLASAMNCMFWVFYGLPVVHPDSVLVISINSVGLVLELIFLTIFFYYTTNRKRVIIISCLIGEIVLLAIVAALTLLCFHSHASRSMFVGIICVVCGTIMYASPLSIIGKVIKTNNPEFMPFWLCLAGFANGVVWFIYAFLKTFDPYIATGNGLGVGFGLIQCLCMAITPSEVREAPKWQVIK